MVTPHGHFHWNELMTRDVEQTKAIYAEVAGWTYNKMNMPDGTTYWVAMDSDDKPVCGMFEMAGDKFKNASEHWMVYLSVQDVDPAVKKAKAHGVKLTRDIFDVEGVGRIAILEQPGGAMIGWMTPSD